MKPRQLVSDLTNISTITAVRMVFEVSALWKAVLVHSLQLNEGFGTTSQKQKVGQDDQRIFDTAPCFPCLHTRKGETRMEIERHSEAYCTLGSADSIQLESIVLIAES